MQCPTMPGPGPGSSASLQLQSTTHMCMSSRMPCPRHHMAQAQRLHHMRHSRTNVLGSISPTCLNSSWLVKQQQQQQWRQQPGRRRSQPVLCSAACSQQQRQQLCSSEVSPQGLCCSSLLHNSIGTSSRSSRQRRLPPPGASLALLEPAAGSLATGKAASAAAGTSAIGVAGGGMGFSQLLAVVLGYCVMAGSLFRSVPQIVKVVQHNSTEGLSLMSYLVELCCYSVVIAYNLCQGYGFNTFGEVVACWLQDIILVALVFKDRRTPLWIIAGTAAAFTAGCAFLLSPACPAALLSTMQASNIAIMALGSRLPQIVLNMRRGNAGMLSVTTCVLNVAGNAARIFTTLVLTGDVLMLGGACSQGCLNTILLCQSVGTARARSRAAKAAAAAAAERDSGSSMGSDAGAVKQPQQRKRQEPEAPPAPGGGGFPALQPAT